MSTAANPLYNLVNTAGSTHNMPVVVPITHGQPAGRPPMPEPYQSQNEHRKTAPSSQQHHAPSLKQFDYKTESRGHAVAVLTLSASSAYSSNMATYLGREPITGSVQLHLDKPTLVKSIIITISGRCKPKDRAGADNLFDEDTTFLDISHIVWASQDSKERRAIMGPPGRSSSSHSLSRNSGSGGSSRNSAVATAADGKLQGDYHWTFAIDLPNAVVSPSTTNSVSFASLSKLREGYYSTAVYTVAVRVIREWSVPDYKIKASINYIPVVWPPPLPVPAPMSANKSPSPMPQDRWHALSPVRIMGTLARSHNIEVGCTLYLAKPLNYDRGSLIPLCMRLASFDSGALDALSAPGAINVRLQKRGALAAVTPNKMGLRLTGGGDDHSTENALAVWTAVRHERGPPGGEQVRYLAGELSLARTLKPTSSKIEYSVLLCSFTTPAIKFAGGEREEILREQLVDIDETIC